MNIELKLLGCTVVVPARTWGLQIAPPVFVWREAGSLIEPMYEY